MTKFIEINNVMINIEDIRRVEFIGDYMHEGLLPAIKEDYTVFNYCKIHTFDGEVTLLSIILNKIEEDMPIDEWTNFNRKYIDQSMTVLSGILNPIKVTGFEIEE